MEGKINHEAHEEHEGISASVESVGREVVDAGLKVHRNLGPCLLESAYEHCLAHELGVRGLSVRRQVVLPIAYDGAILDAGYLLDMLIEEAVIIEVKAMEALTRLSEAQLLTYLKMSRLRLGYLMNFNVRLFRDGLKRLVL